MPPIKKMVFNFWAVVLRAGHEPKHFSSQVVFASVFLDTSFILYV